MAFQWFRDGVAIEGATGDRYRLVAADAGAEITATVTASVEGYADGVATAAAVTVDKIETRSSGSLDRRLLIGTTSVGYEVEVRGDAGVTPTGSVTIYDGLTAVQTVELGADGTAEVTLSNLSRGLHVITVRYAGTDTLAASTGRADLLIVL